MKVMLIACVEEYIAEIELYDKIIRRFMIKL